MILAHFPRRRINECSFLLDNFLLTRFSKHKQFMTQHEQKLFSTISIVISFSPLHNENVTLISKFSFEIKFPFFHFFYIRKIKWNNESHIKMSWYIYKIQNETHVKCLKLMTSSHIQILIWIIKFSCHILWTCQRIHRHKPHISEIIKARTTL